MRYTNTNVQVLPLIAFDPVQFGTPNHRRIKWLFQRSFIGVDIRIDNYFSTHQKYMIPYFTDVCQSWCSLSCYQRISITFSHAAKVIKVLEQAMSWSDKSPQWLHWNNTSVFKKLAFKKHASLDQKAVHYVKQDFH